MYRARARPDRLSRRAEASLTTSGPQPGLPCHTRGGPGHDSVGRDLAPAHGLEHPRPVAVPSRPDVRHRPQGAVGAEVVDVHVLDRVVGSNPHRVDETTPFPDPVPGPPALRLVERGGTPGLGEAFAVRSDDLSDHDRDDHERERTHQHRADDARDRHAGGTDHGELARDGQRPEPDESADHRGEREQHDGMPRNGQEHVLDRAADAVALPAYRIELLDECHHRGERQEHGQREQRSAHDVPGDPGVEDPHCDAPRTAFSGVDLHTRARFSNRVPGRQARGCDRYEGHGLAGCRAASNHVSSVRGQPR